MMAERRAKQQAFEARQAAKADVQVTEDRSLVIYTASINYQDVPAEVEHTFDLSGVDVGINFSLSDTGMDPEIQQAILSKPRFQQLLGSYLSKIESKNYSTILITCNHGFHRSVAMAEAIKRKYPLAKCVHLMLK